MIGAYLNDTGSSRIKCVYVTDNSAVVAGAPAIMADFSRAENSADFVNAFNLLIIFKIKLLQFLWHVGCIK